jgi:Fe-S cluster assembly protein SufD
LGQSIEERVGAGLSAADVEAYSRGRQEPEWLLRSRLDAHALYEAIPLPTVRDEEWRRTDLRGLRLGEVNPRVPRQPVASSVATLDPAIRAEIEASDQAGGLLVQHDGHRVYSELADQFTRKGVIFCDLETAAREHGELVQKYLGQAVTADYSKFSALNATWWTGGTFLYVPRRTEVTLPLRSLVWHAAPGTSSFTRSLIVVEADADVVLVEQWLGPTQDGQSVAANVQEVLVAPGGRIRYVTLQEWGRHVWNFSVNRALVGRDATVNSLVVAFGGRLHKANVESALQGPGASAEMLGLLFGDGNQILDHHTLQDHQAPHTSSDLLYKGALTDRARSIFSGMIHARKVAQKTDAIQTNRNLLLSDNSRADSIPNLEIEANDLRCTHAATVAPVDDEQMFYLQARGLTEQDAKRAIVEGFFEPVLERIPLEGIVSRLRSIISSKIGAGSEDG